MDVINHTMYHDNPYHRLLYRDGSGYAPVMGTVFDAIDHLKASRPCLLHVHWEEDILRRAKTSVEASVISESYRRGLEDFDHEGGVILWTIHNRLPHELHHVEHFIDIRRCLSRLSRRILVHTMDALSVLQSQVDLDLSKIFYAPHPSYLGVYEPEEQSQHRLSDTPASPNFLIFGQVRPYKGIAPFLRAFGRRLPAPVRIVGAAAQDAYAKEVRALVDAGEAITWREGRIEDAAVPDVMRAATALVAPYERTLTSGALLCAMAFGVPMIAPRTPGFCETLPREAHGLLYDPDAPSAILDAMEAAAAMTADEALALRTAVFNRARDHHPDRIGALFSGLLKAVTP